VGFEWVAGKCGVEVGNGAISGLRFTKKTAPNKRFVYSAAWNAMSIPFGFEAFL